MANASSFQGVGPITIGYAHGSTGTVTVSGIGSSFTGGELSIGGNLESGGSGSGTVNVLAGGQASIDGTIIASSSGSMGTLNVSGSGSKYMANVDPLGVFQPWAMFVGGQGTGVLNITGGGQLVSQGNSDVGGSSVGAQGTVTIDGSGSTWTNTGDLTVEIGRAHV